MAALTRLVASLGMLVLVSLVLFTLVHAIPVSPALVVLGPDVRRTSRWRLFRRRFRTC